MFLFVTRVRYNSRKFLFWNPFIKGFIVAYSIQIALYVHGSANNPTPQLWLDNIKKNCVDVDLHVDPELQNFEKFNISFNLIGAMIGVYIDQLLTGDGPRAILKDRRFYEFNYFYRTPLLVSLKRVAICGMVNSLSLIPYFVSKHNPFWIVLLCKSILPGFLGSIYLFGFFKYVSLKLAGGAINETVEAITFEKSMGVEKIQSKFENN